MNAQKALQAVVRTEMAIFAQDTSLRYTWKFNAGNSWLEKVSIGGGDDDILSSTAASRARAIKEAMLKSGEPVHFELPIVTGDATRWFDVRLEIDRGERGEVVGLIGTSQEITSQKKREQTLKTLLRELSHRSKNLLAIIQSLASQTARHSVTVPEFLVRFRGRIQSLSSSQDIVTDTDWRGADLFSLVTMQVERYAPDGMAQIDMAGADVYLSPTAALHVGLAFHELAVNAASYGSLSMHAGRVRVRSALIDQDGERYLRLQWQESAGPRVNTDHDTRFGTSTLERIVPNSVGGEATLSYLPEGVSYTLTIPDTQFEVIPANGNEDSDRG